MTPQQLLLLMGSLMIGMAIAKKNPNSTQEKYIRIVFYAFVGGLGIVLIAIIFDRISQKFL